MCFMFLDILVILNLFQDLFLKAIDSGLRRNDEETGIKYLEYTCKIFF